MLTTMAGPKGNAAAGSVIDVDDQEARRLISGGFAERAPSLKTESTDSAARRTAESAILDPAAKSGARSR
jgi:hypothetical protein